MKGYQRKPENSWDTKKTTPMKGLLSELYTFNMS